MRKLIYAINLSLDGCFDHTNLVAGEDLFDYYIHLVREADLFVYGRKTYQLMVPFWPDIAKDQAGCSKSDIEFAEAFCSVDKVVFSRSLDKIAENDTRLVRSGLKDEVLRLKQEGDGYILTGGVDIPSQLLALGLVDECRFVIQPIVVGKGKRLMEGIDLPERLRLKLVETKVLESGSVLLRYLKQ